MLSFKLADHAGLCAGVSRALKTVEGLLADAEAAGGPGVCLWGPVIHNRTVIDGYKARGAVVTEDFGGLPAGSTVVFRAHGVPPEVTRRVSELGFRYADATCAHVRANQLLARKKADADFRVVIIGDKDHPEVSGVNGWAYGKAVVAGDAGELFGLLEAALIHGEKRLCVLAQTTFSREKFEAIAAAVRERYPDSEIHDTICNATAERQASAAELAGRVDVMIVIGSADSSNAKQLYDICSARCGATHLIETAAGLPPLRDLQDKQAGITASASTPDWIIEEVMGKMEEMKRLDGDIDFAEEMERPFLSLQVGQTVKGRIIRHNSTEVYIDLGYKSDGVIPIEEFANDENPDPAANIVIGDEVDVFVVHVSDSEGTVKLSKKRVDEKNNWARIEEAYEKAAPIKALVTDVTNGGLIVTSNGVRIFVPASHVSDRYVEDLRSYLRKSVELRIIDYNKQKRKFVGSMKVLIIEDKKHAAEQLWNEIEVGREYAGVVKSLTAFGVFVDIGGVDGLVHISELSWSRIKHPSDVLKTGDQITVRVLSLDRDKKKISLGYRREEDNPWYKIDEKYPVGAVVTKRVVRIAPFGAFVELEKGIDALVHISQISDTRIAKPDDVLRVGMEVTAKITELNLETKKISMSIKEVEPIPYIPPQQEGEPAPGSDEDDLPTEHVEEMHTTLGDMLKSAVGDSTIGESIAAEEPADEPAEIPAVEETPVVIAPAVEEAPADITPDAEPVVADNADAAEVSLDNADAIVASAQTDTNASAASAQTDTNIATSSAQDDFSATAISPSAPDSTMISPPVIDEGECASDAPPAASEVECVSDAPLAPNDVDLTPDTSAVDEIGSDTAECPTADDVVPAVIDTAVPAATNIVVSEAADAVVLPTLNEDASEALEAASAATEEACAAPSESIPPSETAPTTNDVVSAVASNTEMSSAGSADTPQNVDTTDTII